MWYDIQNEYTAKPERSGDAKLQGLARDSQLHFSIGTALHVSIFLYYS